ncbi:hypothetical protein CPB97_011734 [Podila verticillata]|nr:hypothetical protein CPB97_011734 [Podila verticillata]
MSTRYSPRRRLACAFLVLLSATIDHNNGSCQATPNTTSPPSTPPSTSTSHSIIRSIGFTGCSSKSSTEQIQLSNLALLYDGQSNTISLKADGSTDKEFHASSAYDRVFYDQKIDLDKINTFIPQYVNFKGKFSFQETFLAPEILPTKLPKQLFSLPAIEALASIQLFDATGSTILCASMPLTNTVSAQSPLITFASLTLTAAAVALSAIASLVVSLSSAEILSMPLAHSQATGSTASPLSPSVWDVVSFCQFIAMSGSLNIEYPELLQQWTQNFGWSMGLVQAEGWNKAINGLRARTASGSDANDELGISTTLAGSLAPGDEEQFRGNFSNTATANNTVTALSMQGMMDGAVKSYVQHTVYNQNQTEAEIIARLEQSKVLANNPLAHGASVSIQRTKTSTATPSSSSSGHHPSTPLTQPGLTTFGHRLNIPAKNMFMTALFLFLILLLVTSLIALLVRITLEVYTTIKPGKFTKLRRRFANYYFGNMLRVVLLAYFAVATLAFYQLTLRDVWPITLLATLTLPVFLALVTSITLRLRRAGGTSLFFDERLRSKYGALYDQYVLSAYLFFVPVLGYQIAKAAMVGLGQGKGDHQSSSNAWIQIGLLLIAETAFTSLVVWKRPFADRMSNRLNAALGCVRVANMVMLAVLIEKAALSSVSRTVVGVLITATQALVMVVLACLVLYQLGRALWRLKTVLKADGEAKDKEMGSRIEGEEVLVISIEDEKLGGKFIDGDEGDDVPGRSALEYQRGSDSMTSLVGMMGIGHNPTIRQTPASDDEDDESGHGVEIIPQQKSIRRSLPVSAESARHPFRDVLSNVRDSIQSYESQSSHILDYYNSAYLPSTIRAKLAQSVQEQRNPSINIVEQEESVDQDSQDRRSSRTSLDVPEASEPWIQAAYMMRRMSESNARSKGPYPSSSSSRASVLNSDQDVQRRPASVGESVRHSLEKKNRESSDRPTISSRSESVPVITYIPESLLEGPPPPSPMGTLLRRSSVLSAMLIMPPSMSPVLPTLHSYQQQHPGQTSTNPSSPAVSPVGENSPLPPSLPPAPALTITSFNSYRFPDERTTEDEATPLTRAVAAAQRNIHPLSPFHPDYQHPDDRYNPNLPSPNDCHPQAPPLPRNSTSDGYTNPNLAQDNASPSKKAALTASLSALLTASKKYQGRVYARPPGLTIVTTLNTNTNNNPVVPPRIPLPSVLPPSPFSAVKTQPGLGEVADKDTNKVLQQLTPDSLGASHESLVEDAISGHKRTTTIMTMLTQMSSSRDGKGVTLESGLSPSPSSSPHQQRALTITLLSSGREGYSKAARRAAQS